MRPSIGSINWRKKLDAVNAPLCGEIVCQPQGYIVIHILDIPPQLWIIGDMRQEDRSKGSRSSEGEESDAAEPRRQRRRASGRKKRPDHGQGFEMPFQMGSFMQMLPLLMAMGNNMPGQKMISVQLRIAMMMVEIWIDYLSMMQEFMERTLKRLMTLSDGYSGFDEDDDDEDDESDW